MWYWYVEIDFGMQKSDQFIINVMAVQSEIQDIYRELLTAEMFARQISGLSAHGTHMSLVGRMTGVQKKVGRTSQKVEKLCAKWINLLIF